MKWLYQEGIQATVALKGSSQLLIVRRGEYKVPSDQMSVARVKRQKITYFLGHLIKVKAMATMHINIYKKSLAVFGNQINQNFADAPP